MPEVVCDVKTIMVDMLCDQCGDGLMRPTGEHVGVYIEHKCNLCWNVGYYKTIYPLTRTIPIEPLREPREDEKI